MYSESGPFDFLYVLDLDNVKITIFLFLIIAMIRLKFFSPERLSTQKFFLCLLF